jgi:hypothetical protein
VRPPCGGACAVGVLGILLLLESMMKAVDDEEEAEIEEFVFSKETQTELTSFASLHEQGDADPDHLR